MAGGGGGGESNSPNRTDNLSNGVNKVDKTPLDDV